MKNGNESSRQKVDEDTKHGERKKKKERKCVREREREKVTLLLHANEALDFVCLSFSSTRFLVLKCLDDAKLKTKNRRNTTKANTKVKSVRK